MKLFKRLPKGTNYQQMTRELTIAIDRAGLCWSMIIVDDKREVIAITFLTPAQAADFYSKTGLRGEYRPADYIGIQDSDSTVRIAPASIFGIREYQKLHDAINAIAHNS